MHIGINEEMLKKDFDLFRVSILMQNQGTMNQETIILSLIKDLFIENNNTVTDVSSIWRAVSPIVQFASYEIIQRIVSDIKLFEVIPGEDLSVKLNEETYSTAVKNIEHGIESFISKFAKTNGYNKDIETSIKNILYESIFENISSFNPNNLKTLISSEQIQKHDIKTIECFNEFIDWDDQKKNSALYSLFAKTVEFAIATTGKGLLKFSKDLFKGKSYLLDTNVIIRLIGIGGEERAADLLNLFDACKHQGIKFYYTSKTNYEFKTKLKRTVEAMSEVFTSETVTIAEKVIGHNALAYNEDFVTYYLKLSASQNISSLASFEAKMLTDFRIFCEKYDIQPIKDELNINSVKLKAAAKELQNEKKKLGVHHYPLHAAEIDAYNIALVKHKRGANNYNYPDTQFFYLTTDRRLHQLLNNISNEVLPETVIPSQLFLIHTMISEAKTTNDFQSFVSFLKKRTVSLKYNGAQILKHIENVRDITTNPTEIRNALVTYSELRYSKEISSTDQNISIPSYREILQTEIDKRLDKAETIENILKDSDKTLCTFFHKTVKLSITITKVIDLVITAIFIPIVAFFIKGVYEKEIVGFIISLIVLEIVKVLVSSKTSFHQFILKKTYSYIVKASSLIQYNSRPNLNVISQDVFEKISNLNNIWKSKAPNVNEIEHILDKHRIDK